jgi:hypothetical protein
MKREVPLLITFCVGLAMIGAYFSPKYEPWVDKLNEWFTIITVFAYILGIGSLIIVNGGKIAKTAPGWGYNAVLMLSFFITLGFGIIGGIKEETTFYWIFQYVYNPLSATMFSLLAFFIASAAFRAFKAKSPEATLLLLMAFVVMIGRVPVGELMWNTAHLDAIMPMNVLIDKWIMGAFNTAGQRAILLGASIGVISVSLKILLGVERSYLGGD